MVQPDPGVVDVLKSGRHVTPVHSGPFAGAIGDATNTASNIMGS